jgi:hypothetical protein
VAHAALVVLGRMNLRGGLPVLQHNSYYSYLPLLFVLVASAALLPNGLASRPVRWMSWLLLALILPLAHDSGQRVWQTNQQILSQESEIKQVLDGVRRLVESGPPSRTIAFDPEFTPDTMRMQGVSWLEIIHRQRVDSAHPDAVIVWKDGVPALEPAETTRQRLNRKSGDLFPQYVRGADRYNIYRFNGRFHGVPNWDGDFTPGRPDHYYLATADSLEQALRGTLVQLGRQKGDMLAGRFSPPQGTTIRLALEGYKGFNIIQYAETLYFAIPQGEGAFSVQKARARGYSRSACSGSLDRIKREIDRLVQPTLIATRVPNDAIRH